MKALGWSRSVAGVVLAGMALAGCRDTTPHEHNQAVQSRVALEAFGSCGALEQYIEDTAVSQMRADLTALKANAGRGGWWGGVPPMAEDAGAPSPGTAGGSAGPESYTTTNTQVAGVDEADFVKNDGTRIFVLAGNRLFATRSWPAEQLSLAGSLEVEGWPQEMFLDQDRVVVFSGIYTPEWDLSGDKTVTGGVAAGAPYWGYWYANTTKVTTVDVSDLAAPKVVGEVYLPGGYVSSRRVGSAVRLVLRDTFRYPREVQFWPTTPEGGFATAADFQAAVDALMDRNEGLIRAASLAQWLPEGKRRVGGALVDVGYSCGDFHATNAPTRLGVASVVTLDMANPGAEVRRTAVVGDVGQVYASASALYLASQHWWWWPEPGQTDATYLHKFDISQPERAVYVASGVVEGSIKDQFSLDEHQGFLRVATTVNRRVADTQNPQNTWGLLERTNRVSVLAERAGRLELHGQTPELAQGESLFGVRFLGARGFLVTYRQVDPLFTLDLSDPANPRVVGELKIPGFSTYLHPVDENHLLGMGEDRNEDGSWTSRALKVSLFDVSDLAHPREVAKYVLGDSSSYSEANWNHKAFNYFATSRTLAVPFSDWSSGQSTDGTWWYRSVSDVRVLRLNEDNTFTFRGALSLGDMFQQDGQYGSWSWSYAWQPWVRRSVMADDYVYAIGDAGIRVAKVDGLSTPLATVAFPRMEQQ